jgi:predicted regulator of Ras-like GTPase activity (Roadblock/LC7/MglB family)
VPVRESSARHGCLFPIGTSLVARNDELGKARPALTMLKGRAIPDVLRQLNTGGTVATILLTSKGDILGCSKSAAAAKINVEVVSGVVANVWQDFTRKQAGAGEQLETLVISLEQHNIVASEVCGQFIICCVATKEALLGMLKMKHAQLCKAVAPTLAQIDV